MILATFYHRPRLHCQKLTKKGRKIGEIRITDFGENSEVALDQNRIFQNIEILLGKK